MTTEDLIVAALSLPEKERAELAGRLLKSLDELPETEWLRIRHEVEKISLLEQQWGWTPPKRVFEMVREAAMKQKQPLAQPLPSSQQLLSFSLPQIFYLSSWRNLLLLRQRVFQFWLRLAR